MYKCPNMIYKVVQIWPGQTVTCLRTISPGHIWTTWYIHSSNCSKPCSPISSLHFPTLIDTSFPFNFTPFHFTFLPFGRFPFFAILLLPSLHPVYNCFPLVLKNLSLHGEIPDNSAGCWFQIFMVLFTKECFPISLLCFLSLIFRIWLTLLW
jgi:hypothetical protein